MIHIIKLKNNFKDYALNSRTASLPIAIVRRRGAQQGPCLNVPIRRFGGDDPGDTHRFHVYGTFGSQWDFEEPCTSARLGLGTVNAI